jgi:hypothetical protein|tara:strand:- start:12 stop:215 length:204 start_codon:yes stop_codon:yes gene_type:complete
MIKNTQDVMNEKSQSDCIMDLMAFLVCAESDRAMYGAVDASAALESVQVLLGYDNDTFDKLKDIFTL